MFRSMLLLSCAGLAISAVVTGLALPRASGTSYRDQLDVFLDLVNTPMTYVFPLIATLLAVSPVYVRLRERFLMLHRIRGGLNLLVWKFFGVAAMIASTFGASVVLWPALVAFVLWPLSGNPNLFPQDYGLSPAMVADDALSRSSYSQLLEYGAGVYVLAYAAILAAAGASFALAAVSAMLLTNSLSMSILSPWLVFIGWTIAASLLSAPRAAPLYSLFPAGLEQAPILESLWPTFAIISVAVGLVALAGLRSASSPWAR